MSVMMSPEDFKAMSDYAQQYGKNWKDRLEQAWLKDWPEQWGTLRCVRNNPHYHGRKGFAGIFECYERTKKASNQEQSPAPRNKTERFLASFAAVEILPEHRNRGDETPCLRDCGIPASIASKLIHWAEHVVGDQSLVCTFEYKTTGRTVKVWHWMEAFLQAAFRKHTEMFGDADLPPAARRMRDTGRFF